MRSKFVLHEIIAGLSTFFTMAYLLILAPQILSEGGWNFGAALTATVLTLAASTIFLALYADYPVVVGPGLSVATFLVFTVIGKGHAAWPQALGLVFWAGLFELILAVFHLRKKMLMAIPLTLKQGAIAGLGLFFLAIGLKQLDIVRFEGSSYSFGELGSAGQLIALLGFLLLLFMHYKKMRAAFLLPILFCWGLSLLFGLAKWEGLFSLPPSLSPTFFKLDLLVILNPELWGILLATLLIALFDAGVTLTVLARMLGWLNKDGSVRNMNRVVIPDAAGSILGSFLGTSCCAFYAESSSGIRAGGKSGITACTAALCSIAALFIFPAISSIPLFATAPALLGLGCLLASELFQIEWKDYTEWLPFLITALAMPYFFSIFWGFALGFISYVAIKVISLRGEEVNPIVWVLAILFAAHDIYMLIVF